MACRLKSMFGGNEILIVAIVALVLFGGSQIPKFARNLGQAQKEFKKGLGAPEDTEESSEATAADSESKNDS